MSTVNPGDDLPTEDGKQKSSTVTAVVLCSVISAIISGAVTYLGNKRTADVAAAELAIRLLKDQGDGPEGAIPRKFALDLLVKSTNVKLNNQEYAAWIDGNVHLGTQALAAHFSSDGEIVLPRGLLDPCEDPVTIPEDGRHLNDRETEFLWHTDRMNLLNCISSFNFLVQYMKGEID